MTLEARALASSVAVANSVPSVGLGGSAWGSSEGGIRVEMTEVIAVMWEAMVFIRERSVEYIVFARTLNSSCDNLVTSGELKTQWIVISTTVDRTTQPVHALVRRGYLRREFVLVPF